MSPSRRLRGTSRPCCARRPESRPMQCCSRRSSRPCSGPAGRCASTTTVSSCGSPPRRQEIRMKVEALLVDDDPAQLDALAEVVQLEGFAVRTAASLKDARDRLAEGTPDVIISDLMLPDGSGLELREHPTAPTAEMVLITGQASVDSAIQALRTGVLDYITKPLDMPRLRAVLANVARTVSVKKEVGNLRSELRKFGRFGPMIGISERMQRVYDLITRAAPTEV